MKPKPTPDMLIAAAHELGHAAAFKTCGIPISHIKITKNGGGHTQVAMNKVDINNPAILQGWATALFAGQAAQTRWCHENNQKLTPTSFAGDLKLFHEAQHHEPIIKKCKPAHLLRDATRIINKEWDWITRHIHELATHGTIRV